MASTVAEDFEPQSPALNVENQALSFARRLRHRLQPGIWWWKPVGKTNGRHYGFSHEHITICL